MIWQNYRLDSTVSKATEDLALWRTEKGFVEIGKNCLAIAIKLDDKTKGYVFHDDGKLLLDTIVETEEGAIGRPIDKKLNEPFLMLGDTEEIQRHLTPANNEDLKERGYENEQGFMDKAEGLLDQFSGRARVLKHECCSDSNGFVFAFPNDAAKLDILVAKGSKLVYKAINTVFVSDENKVVMKTADEMILSSDKKSFVIKK